MARQRVRLGCLDFFGLLDGARKGIEQNATPLANSGIARLAYLSYPQSYPTLCEAAPEKVLLTHPTDTGEHRSLPIRHQAAGFPSGARVLALCSLAGRSAIRPCHRDPPQHGNAPERSHWTNIGVTLGAYGSGFVRLARLKLSGPHPSKNLT